MTKDPDPAVTRANVTKDRTPMSHVGPLDRQRPQTETSPAIVGGAIASQNGYYGPGYYAPGYYGGGPAYVVDPGYGESCIWQRQRFWDGYGWRVRNVRVCD